MLEIQKIAKNQNYLSQRVDFLRGIFSIWVLFAHSFQLFTLIAPPFHQGWFSSFANSGYLGVMGFFFLSGFCIQWSISKKFTSSNPKEFSYLSYIKARFTRIAPLFYIGLFIAIFVEWICSEFITRSHTSDSVQDPILAIVASLVFLQGIFATYGSYAPSWSITNEVIYYLVWPIALIAMRGKAATAFIISVVSAFILTIGFYIFWKKSGSPNKNFNISLWLIPMSSIMWFMGAICRAYHDKIVRTPVFKFLQKWKWSLLIAWLIWTNTLSYLDASLFLRTALNPFCYIVVPLVIMAEWKVPTSEKATIWLADVSYPLYLFHSPLLLLTSSLFVTFTDNTSPIIIAIISCMVALLFSGTLGVRLERIFMSFRRNLSTQTNH